MRTLGMRGRPGRNFYLLGRLGLTLSDMRRHRIVSILVFYYYITNAHKLGWLKHPFISSQFCRSKVQAGHEWSLCSGYPRIDIKVLAQL